MAFARPIVALCALALVACGGGTEKTPTDTGSNNDPADLAVDMGSAADLGGTDDVDNVVPDLATPDMPADMPPNLGNPGIVVQPRAFTLVEATGAPGTFTVVLTEPPSGQVVIPITNAHQAQMTVDSVDVRFETDDWDVPQVVTVVPVENLTLDPPTLTIAIGPATGGGYDGVEADAVVVTFIDDDAPSVAVAPTIITTTESGGSASFMVTLSTPPTAPVTITAMGSPTLGLIVPGSVVLDSTTFSGTFTVTGLDDGVPGGSQNYAIDLTATSMDPAYDRIAIPPVAVTNIEVSTPEILVTPTNLSLVEGLAGTATFQIVLNTDPGANVTVDIGTSPYLTVNPTQVVFDSTNFSTARTITVGAVDNDIATGNQIITLVTTATASGAFAGIDPDDVDVLVTDDDALGISVSPLILATTEGGLGATFTAVLGSEPTADVTVDLVSTDPTEGTVSPTSLTFTSANWNMAQMATVTGVDDAECDGNTVYAITTSVSSTDTLYAAINPPDVNVTNFDDDTNAFVVEPLVVQHTSESGTSITVDVSLNCPTTEDVTTAVSSSNTDEGTVAPASLTFTNANWFTPQTITVTGVDDNVPDGPVQYAIVLDPAVSADLGWNGLDPPNFSVINDDDEPGFVVTPTTITVAEGGSTTFTVRLKSAPIANVRIDITGDGSLGDEYTFSPTQVVFTPTDWDMPRTITVLGVDDAVADGPQGWSLDVSVGNTIDPSYLLECGGDCPPQTVAGTTTE